MAKRFFSTKEIAERWNIEPFEIFCYMKEGLQAYWYGKKVAESDELYKDMPIRMRFGQFIPGEPQPVKSASKQEDSVHLLDETENCKYIDFDVPDDENEARQKIAMAMEFRFEEEDVLKFETEHNLDLSPVTKEESSESDFTVSTVKMAADKEYAFQFHEPFWEFFFEGKKVKPVEINNVRKLVGLKYIHHLISLYVKNNCTPAEPIDCWQLEQLFDGIHPDAVALSRGAIFEEELKSGGLEMLGSNRSRSELSDDEKAEKQRLHKALEQAAEELRKAEEWNDPGTIERARKEYDDIKDFIEKMYGHLFYGHKRDIKESDFLDRQDKSRKRVWQKIKRGVKQIDYAPLREHLKKSLRSTRSALSYNPSPDTIRWEI